MELKDLSKQRYLYKFYVNGLNEPHCEKFRIIYSNQNVVYINKHDDQGLSEVRLDKIHDNLDFVETVSETRLALGVYLWNEVDCTKTSGHEIVAKMKERSRNSRREQLLRNMRYHEDRIEYFKRELEKLEKEK